MTISRDLYLAIFSLDSYNRGYGFGVANLDESGAIGTATIRAFGEDEQDGWVDSDFYATAYNWRGETVIAYRGSDYFDTNGLNLWSRDIWQGWSNGAGFPFGGQPALALRFYEAVTRSSAYNTPGNYTITGHSMGGSLAGFVSALSGNRAVLFDHLPFGVAAYLQAFAVNVPLSTIDPGLPSAYHVAGEVAGVTRGGALPFAASLPISVLAGPGAIFAGLGVAAATVALEVGVSNQPIQSGLGFGSSLLNTQSLHSQALLVSLLWARDNASSQWLNAAEHILPAYFSEAVAGSISESANFDNPGRTTVGYALQSAIAYSALDEGERPFGDVGIRAMFDDAADFGRALDYLPIVTRFSRQAIGETIVEFAGLMALRDVERAGAPEAVNGILQILTAPGGGDGLSALRIDFTDARWSLGGASHAPRGKERIIEGLITANIASDNLGELTSWYYGIGNPGNDLLEQIDEAIFSLAPGQVFVPNTPAGIALQVGSDEADSVGFSRSGNFLFAGNGNDIVTGGDGVDILMGGNGEDLLTGNDGNDWLSGGIDNDSLIGGKGDDRLSGDLGDDVLDGGADDDILFGGAGIDSLLGMAGSDTIDGENGDDIIDGGDDADIVNGGSGNDRILGGLGDDLLFGDADNDIIDGGAGVDTIRGGAGNDSLVGGSGGDTIYGGANDDLVFGGTGADVLYGGEGADIISGGFNPDAPTDRDSFEDNAVDRLTGGNGADIFCGNDGDIITDLEQADLGVFLGSLLLRGGRRSGDDPKGAYTGASGESYLLSGSTLRISYRGAELTILQFNNEDARIKLTDDEDRPDPDEAERNRDPLVIDLDGDRQVVLNNGRRSVYFDMNSDGFAELSSWLRPSDALLAIDRNNDGVINDAGELFGNGFVRTQGTFPLQQGTDGFRDLGQHDLNNDQQIDANDAIYSQLRLWVDSNSDGITDAGELRSLAEQGLQSISLRTRTSDHLGGTLASGTTIPFMSSAMRTDGTATGVYDVFLGIDPNDTRRVVRPEISDAIAALPFVVGSGTLKSLDEAMAGDPALEEMVRDFATLDIGDTAEIADRVEEILFRWTGADQVAENRRGPNINARWLHVIEQLSGRPFDQARIGPNPRADAAALLAADYTRYLHGFTAKLLCQTALGRQLLPGLTFEAGATFTIAENISISDMIAAAATGAPAGRQDALRYWATIIDVLDTYRDRAALSSVAVSVALNPILAASGLPLDINALRSAVVATSGGDAVINAWAGNQYLLADREAGSLRGTAPNSVYVIGRVDGLVSINPGYRTVSDQVIMMSEHRREDFVIEFENATALDAIDVAITVRLVSKIDNTIVELPAIIGNTGLVSAISRISFLGGAMPQNVQLTDFLAGGTSRPGGDGQIFFGLNSGLSVIEGGAGNDLLLGFGNADEYRFGPGGGNDTIIDRSTFTGGADTLVLAGVRADYRFEQAGPRNEDLRVIHIASGNFVTVTAQLSLPGQQIENFRFGDGVVLTASVLAQEFSTGTAGADILVGTFRDDFINGLGGGDVLDGRQGEDRYFFEAGDGAATIIDTDTVNIVRFGAGITADDLRLITGERDIAIAYGQGDVVYLRRTTAASNSPIATIEFDDGSSMSFSRLVEQSIAAIGSVVEGELFGTSGDETLVGSSGNDLIDGSGGNDNVNGGGGNDTFVFRDGRLTIADGPFSFDTLLIPAEYTLDNFILELDRFSSGTDRIRVRFNGSTGVALLPNRFTSNGNPDSATADDIDRILFADGFTINLALGSVETGTAGNDVLLGWRDRFHPGGSTIFRPGAGDDFIFAGNSNQTLQLSVGFGRDVLFADSSSNVELTNISRNLNTEFARIGNDLRISFAGTSDQLTIKHLFDYRSNAGLSTIRFANQTLNYQQIVELTSVATPNADVLFETATLDGGAGDDVLIGNFIGNNYVFGRGYGHDVIKERDFFEGNNSGYTDTLLLLGLNRSDVTFSRSATDPLAMVITIKETGETLTLDGSPFDGEQAFNEFLNGGSYETDVAGAHWLEIIQFADGETISQIDLVQAVFDGEATNGTDTIVSLGSEQYNIDGPVLDGGEGNDLYENRFRAVHVRLSADGGNDRLVTKTTNEAPAAYNQAFTYVHLDADVAPSDVLVLFELRDRFPVTVLKTKFGSELVIEEQLYNGERSALFILAADGQQFRPTEDGGLIPQLIGSQDVDYLTGQLDVDNQGEGPSYETSFDETFEAGEGDDYIAGRGGDDVLIFNRGDGNDRLLGDQRPRFGANVLGRGVDGSGSYSIQFGDDIAAEDIDILWLDGLTDIITIRLRGSNDQINVRAPALSELRFVDGTTLSFDGPQTVFFVDPGFSAGDLTDLNETIIATGGNISVSLTPDGGRDLLIDRQFEDALEGSGNLNNWSSNEVNLLGGTSIDDFDFIRDTNEPDNLVVRNRLTGAELIVRNQFALETDPQDAWQSVPVDAGGNTDWLAIDQDGNSTPDFAFLDPDQTGVVDWASFETAGPGAVHWERYRYGSIALDQDGSSISAFDDDGDGNFELFELYRPTGEGGAPSLALLLLDTNGDGVPDEYSTDYDSWTAVPLLAGGGFDWAAIDANGDSLADRALLDPDNNGIGNWQVPDFDRAGTDWQTQSGANLYDADDNLIGSRSQLEGYSGNFYSFYTGIEGSGQLVAWDTDGDLIPDRFGLDFDNDGIADSPANEIVVDRFVLSVESGGSTNYSYFNWTDIEGRVVNQAVQPLPPSTYFDLSSIMPTATQGDDRLRVVDDTIDSLGGNDLILASGDYATLRYGRGDGDDVFLSEYQPPAQGQQNGTRPFGRVEFKEIFEISELHFARGGDNLEDLIVTIRDTGETLTIVGQLRGTGLAVLDFALASGQSLSWDDVVLRIESVSNGGDNELATGDEGGLLDGGSGFDELNGGIGDDIYRFGRGFDEDTIRDAGGFDAIRFDEGIDASDLFFSRTGSDGADLLIEVNGEERLALTIRGQFAATSARVERLELFDGSVIGWSDVQRFILANASTGADDEIVGFDSNDRIGASAGNDLITGGRGNDAIDGGAGRDSAIYRGLATDYEITTINGVTTVRDLVEGRDGTDTLRNVEDVNFLGDGSTVSLSAPNSAPTAATYEVDTSEDNDVVVARASLFALASDADGDALLLRSVTDGANGRAWIDRDGNIRYRPNTDFNGADSFGYTITDGNGGVTAAQINVTVMASNDAPRASSTVEDQLSLEDRTIDFVLPGDLFTDVDGDTVTFTAALASGDPLPGWLIFDGSGFAGSPPANFNGRIDVIVHASDGASNANTAFAFVILPVNDAPTASGSLGPQQANAGSAFSFILPNNSFIDAEGDALTLTARLADGGALPNWLVFDGSRFVGNVPVDDDGDLRIVLFASDGQTIGQSQFTLSIAGANAAPLANSDDLADIAEDSVIEIAPSALLANDNDADGDSLSITAVSDGIGGTVELLQNGEIRFTATANYNGPASFRYAISDGRGGVSSAVASFAVLPLNDAPDAINDLGFTTDEDTPLEIAVATLLANDIDIDNDTITIAAIELSIGGAAVLDGNVVRFTPTANFYGDASFTYRVSDGQSGSDTAVATVRVMPINDPPIVMNDIADLVIDEDSAVDLLLPSSAFVDVDGDALSLAAQLSNGNPLPSWLAFDGTRLSGQPPANFNGTLAITIAATDGSATAAQQLLLTINPVNDAPNLVSNLPDVQSAEESVVDILLSTGSFSDIDGDQLSYSATLADGFALPTWLSLDSTTGRLTGTPPANFNGSFDILVTASDGALRASDTFRLEITQQNDAPTLVALLTDVAVNEDNAIDFVVPANSFADVDNDALTFSATLADGSNLPTWLLFDAATRRFTGTPPTNYNGFVDVRVIASDGTLSASDEFRLTVTPVNDAPVVAAVLADRSSAEDNAIDFTLPAGSFTDVDASALSYVATLASGAALPTWMSFDAATLRFTGTPPADFNGFVDVHVTASDGSLAVSDEFRLTIDPVNDAPVLATAIADRTSTEDTAIEFTIPANSFTDVDNATLTLSASLVSGGTLPIWLSFDAANGHFSGMPPANFNGFIDVRVTASDGALSVFDDFRLNVTAVNDAPTLTVALADRSSAEDTAIDFTVPAGSFTDVDNASLTYASTLATGAALPSWLSFDATTQRFTGTPPANFNGFIDVRVTASDGPLSASNVFRLSITPANDAPIAANDSGFTAVDGNPLVINATALLANDNDPDGNALTITAVGNAVGGTVVLNAQGQVVYTASAGYQGTGSFSYTVSDGSLTATATANIQVTSGAPGWVYGTPGNDSINGSANLPNRIDGLAGKDTIVGGTQNDELVGGAGNDNIYAGAGNDIITAGDGDDTVTGDAGNDTIAGGLGVDKLYGGLGDDIIDAGDGNDTVTGDDGNDNIIGGNGDDLLYAGAGNDSVDGGAGNDTITGDAGTDTLVGGTGNDNVYGGNDNDSLSGGDGTDKLYGDAGNDVLSGGAGNDTIDGGAGIDTVDYSLSTAAWTINLATNSASSVAETDIIYNMENVIAGAGNDILTGTTAANSLTGGAGNDTLNGGLGNDMLVGGTGSDIAVFEGVSTTYSIGTLNGVVQVIDNAPSADRNDGTDTISSIEQLRFKGGTTVNVSSPIILDLDGNGVKTVSAADSNARYDLDGDGLADDTSWIGNTEGFLFLDRDGNGTVNNAGEFSFIDDVAGAKSDLDGLRAFDSNNDGILSSLDAKFAQFKVWQDRDGDGAAEEGEILSLTQANVRSIKLTGTAVNGTTQLGDVAVVNKGSYTRTNGATMEFLDAALTYFSAATNMPAISVQSQSQTHKSDKYRISFADGAMTLGPKSGKGQIDPRAGLLGASNLMTFKNESFGLLSPIILDLDGDGVEMKSIKKAKASFDMNSDGMADDTGWTGTGDGFLVIDRNNDGKITHASELSFAGEDKDAKSDFEALAALDSNGDRVIDDKDARFKELKVWVDADSDGFTDAGELKTLEEAGVTAIGLIERKLEGTAKVGDNALISTSTFTRANGGTGTLGNAALAYKPGTVSSAIDGLASSDGNRLLQPDRVIPENPDFDPSDPVGTADLGNASNGPTAAEQAVATLSGAKSGGGFIVPPLNMFESGPAIINIFDYYEQPGEQTITDATTGNEPTSLRLVETIGAPATTKDLPSSLRTISIDNVLLTPHSSPDPSARLLAIIAQDMAAFGAKSGENEQSWRKDVVKPVEYFA